MRCVLSTDKQRRYTWAIISRILSKGVFFKSPFKFNARSHPHSKSKLSRVFKSNRSWDRPTTPLCMPKSIRQSASSVRWESSSISIARCWNQSLTSSADKCSVLHNVAKMTSGFLILSYNLKQHEQALLKKQPKFF